MTEDENVQHLCTENIVRLRMAADILRDMTPGDKYDIDAWQLESITKPLALQIIRILEPTKETEWFDRYPK